MLALADIPLLQSVAVSAAAPVATVRLGQGGGDIVSWERVLFSLVFCLLLALAIIWLLRLRDGNLASIWPNWQGRMSERRLKLAETLAIAPGVSVSIIAIDGEEFLLLNSTAGLRLLPLDEGVANGE